MSEDLPRRVLKVSIFVSYSSSVTVLRDAANPARFWRVFLKSSLRLALFADPRAVGVLANFLTCPKNRIL